MPGIPMKQFDCKSMKIMLFESLQFHNSLKVAQKTAFTDSFTFRYICSTFKEASCPEF